MLEQSDSFEIRKEDAKIILRLKGKETVKVSLCLIN
jgi:hypothetical protein